MTLQRRVLLYLLLSAPLVWAAGLLFTLGHAREEIDELYDTGQVRVAQQLQAVLPGLATQAASSTPTLPASSASQGDADEADLAIAVWDRSGRRLLNDREGALIPYRAAGDGFDDQTLAGQAWRTYYLRASSGAWLVAVAQRAEEREELVQALVVAQLLPWVLTLPVLLIAMAAAVRQSLKPLRSLSEALRSRASDDLRPFADAPIPGDLKPLVQAINGLLQRVEQNLEHERRFTADAAHELRTPLAALQAQWDAARLTAGPSGRADGDAQAKISAGLDRLRRLVTQMLSLERLERQGMQARLSDIDWSALVEQVFSDVLPQADRRHVELACEWPPQGSEPPLRRGDAQLLAVLLRNLLDNAVAHSPPNAPVRLCLSAQAIEVVDEGPGVAAELLPRLGERFFRVATAGHDGSGLGLSIARRIAALHGLRLSFANEPGRGFRARLSRDASTIGG